MVVRLVTMLVAPALLLTAGCQGRGDYSGAATNAVAPVSSSLEPLRSAAAAVPIPDQVLGQARALPARRSDVAIVGDSLTVGAQPYLSGEFAAVGSDISYIRARSGIPTALGLSYLDQHRDELPGTVILALGTNDVTATPDQVVGWLNRAREIIGAARRLVWVNLSMANQEYPNDDVFNAVLAESAARDPRLLVLDWKAYTADNRIGHAVDGVHYTNADYRRRANFYTCAVVDSAQCRPYQLGVSPDSTPRVTPASATSLPAQHRTPRHRQSRLQASRVGGHAMDRSRRGRHSIRH